MGHEADSKGENAEKTEPNWDRIAASTLRGKGGRGSVTGIKHFAPGLFSACVARCTILKLELGVRAGLIPRSPMNPLRSRWTASPVHHPQASARRHQCQIE